MKKNHLTVLFLVLSFGFAACKPAQPPRKTVNPPASGTVAPSGPSGAVPAASAKPATGGVSSVKSSATNSDETDMSDEELGEEFDDDHQDDSVDGFPAYNEEDFGSPVSLKKKVGKNAAKGSSSSAAGTRQSPNTNDVNLAKARLLSEAEAYQGLMNLLDQVRPEIFNDLMEFYRANQKNIESDDAYYGERLAAKRSEIFDLWSDNLATQGYVPVHLVDYFWKEVLDKDPDLSLEWIRAMGLSEGLATGLSESEVKAVFDEANKPPVSVAASNSTPDPIPPSAPPVVSGLDPVSPVEEDLEQDTPESIAALKIEVAGLLGVKVEKIQTWPVEKLKVSRARLVAAKAATKSPNNIAE